jgi:polysaccharide export outer membrane protein
LSCTAHRAGGAAALIGLVLLSSNPLFAKAKPGGGGGGGGDKTRNRGGNQQTLPGGNVDPTTISGEPPPEPPPVPSNEGTYIIGIEDHLNINVWKEELGPPSATVRPDGFISMPIVGDVLAVGRTPMQLAREIEDRLKDYLMNPTVTVGIQQINSYRVFVTGPGIARGGNYSFKSPTRLMEALVLAGGFSQFADEEHVRVFSDRGDGTQEMVEINTKKIVEGKDLSLNILVKPRDMIYVP